MTTAAEKFWRAAMGQKDDSVRTVILHNCHRVEIPIEFFNYYVEMRLLRAYPKWPELGFLRFGLKAEVDKVNGGLRFWVKKMEPVEEYAPQSSYYYATEIAWYLLEDGGQIYSRYDNLQRRYREMHGTERAREVAAHVNRKQKNRNGIPTGVSKRLGISPEEYKQKKAAGLKHCSRCHDWHPTSWFGSDISTADRLSTRCSVRRRLKAVEAQLFVASNPVEAYG
jgi:hypothetical protein